MKEFEEWMYYNKDEMIRIFIDMYKSEFDKLCKESYEDDKKK